ncbi:MAG: hypothetical protein KDA86_27515, partial [Planctomycetaceae bacterium]|nr:hypothetical protein [Planctomycetaceae bacterium]
DLDDYAAFMEKQLRTLRHFERCLFAMRCADHLLAVYSDLLAESLSKPDVRTIRRIVKELWASLLSGVIPDSEELNALDMDFMGIDVGWADPASDVHPVASIVQQSIGMCILCCRRNDVGLTQMVAHSVIECLDYKLEEVDPDYSPDDLFERPETQHELEAQAVMMKHLRGEYELNKKLRTMFR